MKLFIIIVLCSSLLLEGCYSSSIVTGGERRRLVEDPSEQIEINLLDGSTVCVDSYHYIEVSEPSDFVYVVAGERFERKTGKYESFRGSIHPMTVDSIGVDTVHSGPGLIGQMRRYDYIFRLADSSSVRCHQADYFTVTSKQGAGLWCAGNKADSKSPYWLTLGIPGVFIWAILPSGAAVNGRIPFDQIESIEVRRFSTFKTVLLGIGYSALIAVGIAGANLPP